MPKEKLHISVLQKTTYFLQLQFYLTLFIWPILICWGIPLSILSPLGNFIFTPFLFIFLLLSSIIFFFEIIYIPNQWLIYVLDYLCIIWIKLINIFDNSCLITCKKPSTILLAILPLLAILIIAYKQDIKSQLKDYKKLIALSLALLFTFCYLKLTPITYPKNPDIQCLKKQVHFFNLTGQNILIDNTSGFCQIGALSWSRYTFIPDLYKQGITKIDHLVVLKATQTTFQVLKHIVENINVKNLYIPHFTGELKNIGWQYWHELTEACSKTKLIIIKDIEIKINLSDSENIIISPSSKIIKKNKIAYPKITSKIISKQQTFEFEN